MSGSVKPKLILKIVVILAVIAIAFVWHGFRRGDDVLIPENYRGWVAIHYRINGQPSLPMRNGRYVLVISASGTLLTSSERASGYGRDNFYFLSSLGNKSRIPREAEGCQQQVCASFFEYYYNPNITVFYVGRSSDLSQFTRPSLSSF